MLGTRQDVCKTNRNCNTSKFIFDSHVSDAYVFASYLMLVFTVVVVFFSVGRDVRFGPIGTFGDRVAELVHRDLRAGHTIQESLEVEACELVLRLLSQMRGKGSGGARIACF